MKKISFMFMAVLAILTMLVAGCVVPATPGPTPQPQSSVPATGIIEVRVTDAPAGYEVTSIMVTIAEDGIQVHKAGSDNQSDNQTEGEWITIPITGDNPFDLLLLEDVEAVLGSSNMTAGRYTQIRMDIEQVEVSYEKDGVPNTVNATLPSGKLKFVRPFEVLEGETTVLLLDFDAEKSVIFAGAGRVMVKPVVKLMVSQGTEPLEITTTSLPDGEVGTSYNATVEASGGTLPYTWNISGGSLPDGLALDADTGVISGNATAEGDFDFTVRVRDSSTPRLNDTEELSIHIDPEP